MISLQQEQLTKKDTTYIQYCIAFCDNILYSGLCLQVPNLCELYELSWAHNFLYFCFSSLHVSQFRACDFFILCLCLNTSKEWTFLFLLCCLTQKVSTSPNVTCPNILVDMVSPNHRIYSNYDSTSDLTSHTIACDNFMRSSNLVVGLLCRYNNHRYYCWAEKLMLCRNCALPTKRTVR